jgi:ribosomal protein S2
MFSSVRKVVVHRAFAKAASLLPDRTLYYMNRRFLGGTVTNTFAGHCIKCRSPPDASLRVLESQHTNYNRQDTVRVNSN